ncbi:MAG TPA: NYN domain-containing protein [Ignavibacteriaceae bacterium]|nr:NYN domain-containing protein [Ignavibacteriaceae bacterium]
MNKFFIDGNNLIGKIKWLKQLQKKDGQSAREQLVFILERFFCKKKIDVTVYFDGFQKDAIKSDYIRIIYSGSKTADELIKNDISNAKNRKKITVVSSDRSISDFARACSSATLSSESFYKQLSTTKNDTEEKEIDKLSENVNEFKKLFGVKE